MTIPSRAYLHKPREVTLPSGATGVLQMGQWLPSACPKREEHTPSPSGYVAWFTWAQRMTKTHRQTIHPACGLYAVWVPKDTATAAYHQAREKRDELVRTPSIPRGSADPR